eukprot:scaffold587_cov339-Pavlova_lutheri.AAC.15
MPGTSRRGLLAAPAPSRQRAFLILVHRPFKRMLALHHTSFRDLPWPVLWSMVLQSSTGLGDSGRPSHAPILKFRGHSFGIGSIRKVGVDHVPLPDRFQTLAFEGWLGFEGVLHLVHHRVSRGSKPNPPRTGTLRIEMAP